MTVTDPIFKKLIFARHIRVKNYTKFHENSVNDITRATE